MLLSPERSRLTSFRAWFAKFLLSVGLILCGVHASAQEVGRHAEMLTDRLPPTTIVPTNPRPYIIWHHVHGHWRWHCVAHCSKYQRPYKPNEQGPEVYDSSGRHQVSQTRVPP